MSAYNIVRVPEIERVLFPQRPEERAELEKRVLEEGIRDALVVWRRGLELVLVDGHNRHDLAQKHGLEFKVTERDFGSIEECIEWIYRTQIGRRNLTDEQRAIIIGRMYMIRNEAARKADGGRELGQAEPNKTAKVVAKEVGVSEKTVRNAAAFAQALDKLSEVNPEAADRVLTGEVKDALTRLTKMKSDAEIERAAEKIASGATRIGGDTPTKQAQLQITSTRDIVISVVLERLSHLEDVFATRLGDGTVLAVRQGRTVALSICGVAPADIDRLLGAGVPILNVEKAEEAEKIVLSDDWEALQAEQEDSAPRDEGDAASDSDISAEG